VYNSATVIIEEANFGDDHVGVAVDYTLAEDVSIELFTTTSVRSAHDIDLFGNQFAQTTIGNAGDNMIGDGGGAADILIGHEGDDIYLVYSSGTTVTENAGEGDDTVAVGTSYALAAGAEIEQMRTTSAANTRAIDLTGNAFDQTIFGNAGANRIDGGGGADVLHGSRGADTFVFSTALGSDNVDTIYDFRAGLGTIELDSAVFQGLTAGALDASAFGANAAGAALDADVRIIYETDTGALFYDADGSDAGAAVQFAIVRGSPDLGSGDFIVV
jgi:Ca2+-binding RTX toxin-like protein